jgi:hypothetical protein
MDHLQSPQNPIHPPVEVRYVCLEERGGDFSGYQERKGLSTAGLDKLANQDHAKFESFWQTWMFFGLLKSVFGKDVPSADFIRSAWAGECIVTTRLQYYADIWSRRIRFSGLRTERADQGRVAAAILERAADLLVYLNQHYDDRTLDPIILFSFGVLHEFLCTAKKLIFPQFSEFHPISTSYPGHSSLHFPLSRMRLDGWYPERMHLLEAFPPSLRYFVSQTQRPDAHRDHAMCTELQCLAYESQITGLRPRHVSQHCNCRYLHADQKKLHSILLQGTYPVLRIHKGSGGLDKAYIDVLPMNEVYHYVSMSHVWSDGLGNPTENALPLCQLALLQSLVDKIYPEEDIPAFWIDSICRPTAPIEAKELGVVASFLDNGTPHLAFASSTSRK